MIMETYEKKYKEALERARQFSKKPYLEDSKGIVDYIFPELIESDDERIKKRIIEWIEEIRKCNPNNAEHNGDCSEAIAWLENQGKNNMGISEATKQKLEDNLRKALEKETPESLNEFLDEQGEQKPFEMISPEESLGVSSEEYNKIVDECIYGEQNHAWGEEDEKMLNDAIGAIGAADYYTYDDKQKMEDWLKSLKDRVQPQNKWKESLGTADLENSLCDIQDGFSDTSYEYRILGEAIEFIRCTEPKSQWKPSDEQMRELSIVAKGKGWFSKEILSELLEQLKKLREGKL